MQEQVWHICRCHILAYECCEADNTSEIPASRKATQRSPRYCSSQVLVSRRRKTSSRSMRRVSRRSPWPSMSQAMVPRMTQPKLQKTFGVSPHFFTFIYLPNPTQLDQIVQRNQYFPLLHKLFHSRPNATPICLTTGLGPNGAQTVLVQQPDGLDSEDAAQALGDSSFDTSNTSMQTLLNHLNDEVSRRDQQDLEPEPPLINNTSSSAPMNGAATTLTTSQRVNAPSTPASTKSKGKSDSTQRGPKTSVFSASRPRKSQRKGIEELLAGNLEYVLPFVSFSSLLITVSKPCGTAELSHCLPKG